MLSEDSIDTLMQPIITRQEGINTYIINKIAERVNDIGKMLPSDIYKLERLLKTGSDVKLINNELAKVTRLQIKDIKKLIRIVAQDVYLDTKPFYDYRHLSFIPFDKNTELQSIVTSIATQTAEMYINMSKSQAFMIRDLTNPSKLIPTTISDTYQTIVDEAIQANSMGIIDYHTAMRRTMKQLNESGIRCVIYQAESGRIHTQRLDTVVRRNLLDGVRAINQGVQDETGRQYGADGKEISVHQYPAPDHAEVQGHQFTNEEYTKMQDGKSFKDIQSRAYEAFERKIGTLNCRHFAFSIIIGYAKPNYTDKQLNQFLVNNNRGYTLPNGNRLTMYQCTQEQRRLETEVRKAKDGQIMAKKCGDIELAKQYQAKINEYTTKYNSFSKSCGLVIKPIKTTVSGYRKIKL
jgi:hypothetical protein